MNASSNAALRIGAWHVDPRLGQMSSDGKTVRLEARTLRLLLCLAGRPGEVVSIDELLDQVWSGVVVSPDSVYQAVAALRRLLGDDARQPDYIVTVPRLGYRLVAPVTPAGDPPELPGIPADAPSRVVDRQPRRPLFIAGIACAVLAALGFGAVVWHRTAAPGLSAVADHRSVVVLPFLDLTTDEMTEETFADGMTEELITRLSKVDGLKVPSATASFYYKGKQVPLPVIARALGTAYAIDGSIRRSGTAIRVAVRLVRADDGFVVWAETYDRPLVDRVAIQDDIATSVVGALRGSIR